MMDGPDRSSAAAPSLVQQPSNLDRRRWNGDSIQLILAIVAVLGMIVLPAWLGSGYWTYVFQVVCLYVTVSTFQNLLLIDAGQMSFGQGAIFGLAAYTAGSAAGLYDLPYWAGMLLGIATAGVAGLLFALPALRVQGFYLGFLTLSAAVIFPQMVVALNRYTNGINGVVVPSVAFFEADFLGVGVLSWSIGGLAIAAIGFHVWLRSTRLGRAMRVASASPECAQSLGVNPGLMRSIAFAICALGTGAAGVLYPPVGIVSPDAFQLDLSILFFFSVIVGGRGEPLASIFGVAVLYVIPNVLLAGLSVYRLLAYGSLALLVMLFFPDGIIGSIRRALRRHHAPPEGIIPIGLALRTTSKAADVSDPGHVVLEVRGASKNYGRVAALSAVDFDLRAGEIHGLVGANGSGKTSLLNVLTGFSRLDSGSLVIKGRSIGGMPAHRISRLGIGRSFQTPRIFPFFSGWQNVEVGLDGRSGTISEILLDPIRVALAGLAPEFLPHGQRRLVEIMRIVLKDADILLLDEPAAGLSPAERTQFGRLLSQLSKEAGKSIVLVEHDLQLVWGVADRVTVLDAGRIVASGTPDQVRANPAVQGLFVTSAHA